MRLNKPLDPSMKSKLKRYFSERLVLLLFCCMVFELSKSSRKCLSAKRETWESKGKNWNVNVIVFAFVASCYSTRTRVRHFMHFTSPLSWESRSHEFTTPVAAWNWCSLGFNFGGWENLANLHEKSLQLDLLREKLRFVETNTVLRFLHCHCRFWTRKCWMFKHLKFI